jgi:uncharacterized protein
MSHTYKFLLAVLSIGAIAYLIVCILLVLWQNRLIFLPSSIIEITPDKIGLLYEEIWLPVDKEEILHGWWLPSPSPTTGVLLYLHGNGENIGANVAYAQKFHQLGFDVLLIDYRGYGRSKGKFPTETQVYKDAQTAWDYLIKQRGIKPKDIFIYGHSLGGAIAFDLAVVNPEAAGLIVEGTFTSMSDMAVYQGIYKIFPANLLVHQRFDSLSKIESLRIPILLIHGSTDRVVPASMSQVLYDAATVPKKLLIIPDAGHNNVAFLNEEKYLTGVWDFYQLVRDRQRQTVIRN